MTLLLWFGLALFGVILFWWWQGVSQFKSLESGKHGPFTVSKTSGSGDSYLAWDAGRRKVALVNNPIPEFNGKGHYTSSRLMTVVFDLSEVASVSLIEDQMSVAVHFYFTKPVPGWNIRKELVFMGGHGIVRFFAENITDVVLHRYRKNNTGGVDPL